MIQVNAYTRILVAIESQDFRKGIDGLAAVCRKALGSNPFSGALFVFRNRKGTAVKILAYDGQGFWLCHKRLSRGKFRYWPSAGDKTVESLLGHELSVLLSRGDSRATKFKAKDIEPNSSLGVAIGYMTDHWEKLTLFLKVPGAPIDNNICERAIKKAILHRKNAMFFKTENGAYVADLFMSLIHTCELEGVNPFDYLVTLANHAEHLVDNPAG